MNVRAGVSWSSMSTPRNWTRPAYCAETCARLGASLVQGLHHDAHTFTTTGFPFSVVSSPRNCVALNVGRAVADDGGATGEALGPFGLPVHAARASATAATSSGRDRTSGMTPSIVPDASPSRGRDRAPTGPDRADARIRKCPPTCGGDAPG